MKNKLSKISASPFSRYNPNGSKIDIIIPFHGQYDKVWDLVKSILHATKTPYKIYLVDDASPNKSFINKMKDVPNTSIIRSETHLGFGGALQLGFKASGSPWVCFLNSDCLIKQSNWLAEMGKSLLDLKDKKVRMVSARTNNPGFDADPRLKLEFFQDETTENDIILDGDNYLPLYCVMCHRDLFQHIGGFVKNYPVGWYEDQELAKRMRHYGYKQAICTKSWVYHEGEATLKEMWRNQRYREMSQNNYALYQKDVQKLNI